MKTKVLQIFQDAENLNKFHCPGEIADFKADRAKELEKRGLVEIIEEPKAEPKEEPKAEAPKKTAPKKSTKK